MHVIYNEASHLLKVYEPTSGVLVLSVPCRNDTVGENAWRYPDAGCPPGEYQLGRPEVCDPGEEQTSMGPYFIPVDNVPGHYGIGIHGGGTCVAPHSMDPEQGWCPTENCFRLQNADLRKLVDLIPNGGSSFSVYQNE